MIRGAFALVLVGMFGLLVATTAAEEAKSPPPPKTAAELQDRLARKITIDGFEPNTPLKDALGFLSDCFGLTIIIDTQAFRDELQINEPEQQPIRLPKMGDVPVREVLRLLCDQAQGAVVQTGTVIWMVPPKLALPRLLAQTVDVSFINRPLDQALQEISAQTGANVVLDASRLGNGNPPVTARLRGAGLENAVRVLADSTGLKLIVLDQVLYVTTPEHADELWNEQAARRNAQEPAQKGEKAEEKHELKTPKKEDKKGKGPGA